MLKLFEKLGTLLGICTTKKPKTSTGDNKDSGKLELLPPNIIEGTPFCTVQVDKNSFIVIFGKSKITERMFETKEQAESWARQIDWFTILNVVAVFIENYQTIKTNNTSKS